MKRSLKLSNSRAFTWSALILCKLGCYSKTSHSLLFFFFFSLPILYQWWGDFIPLWVKGLCSLLWVITQSFRKQLGNISWHKADATWNGGCSGKAFNLEEHPPLWTAPNAWDSYHPQIQSCTGLVLSRNCPVTSAPAGLFLCSALHSEDTEVKQK